MKLPKDNSAYLKRLLTSLFIGLGIQSCVFAQDSTSSDPLDDIVPKALTISHIIINDTYIDFARLSDPSYRQTLEYGKELYGSFDSVADRDNYPLNLNLPHFLNDLTIHFSAVDWDAPHKIKYSYLLEGSEEDWSIPQDEAKVDLWNLNHGRYVLKIRAIGETGVWTKPLSYSFSIKAPWWLSWWAYTIYVVFATALLLAAYSYWKERKHQEAEIERLLEAYKLTDFPKAFQMNKATQESSFLNLVQTTLETHLSDENFGIAELCELLNISRTQLHRKLKKLTGLSTSHYIRSLRLEIAKSLLESSQLNVSEVAFKVGFSSPTYFSKVFKIQYGRAPSDLLKT